MATCEIDWAEMSIAEWEARFRRVQRSTLLQHFPYAHADRRINPMGARQGLIRIDGEEAGLFQIGEVGLLRNLIHVIQLDRGPLWFPGFETSENATAFFDLLGRTFPRRLGRKRRILAELDDTQANRRLMESAGFVRKPSYQGYETIWVDLTAEPDRLRARLDGNWRRFLGKSERTQLAVEEDWSCATRASFLEAYDADRRAKNYPGPSLKMVATLIALMVPRQEAVILNASESGATVAAMLILLHGSSATYLVGWNGGEGRKLWAHHRLFWHTLTMLRARGITAFDLGGVNDETAQGIKRFKTGLGGDFRKLVGFYS